MNDSGIYPEWANDLKAPATYNRFYMDHDKDELKAGDAQPVSTGTSEPLATDTDFAATNSTEQQLNDASASEEEVEEDDDAS